MPTAFASACFRRPGLHRRDAGATPGRLAAGDIDNDGDLDLVVANGSVTIHAAGAREPGAVPSLSIFRNTGDWDPPADGFAPAVDIQLVGQPLVNSVPAEVALADMDTDFDLDIVVSLAVVTDYNGEPYGVVVLLNDGAGGFSDIHGPFPTPFGVRGLAVDDLNNDGHQDAAVAVDVMAVSSNPNDPPVDFVYVLYGNGAGGLGNLWPIQLDLPFPYDSAPNDLVIAPFDNQFASVAYKDIVSANMGDGTTVSMITNFGFQNFQDVQVTRPCPLGEGDWYFADITTGQFSATAVADLAAPEGNGGYAAVLHGDGYGHFTHDCETGTNTDRYCVWPTCAPMPDPYAGTWSGITNGQLNGGKKLDLVVSRSPAGAVTFLLGNGDGTFLLDQNDSRFFLSIGGMFPMRVIVADLDGSGFGDIITTNHGTNDVTVLINKMASVVPIPP